MRTNTLNPIAIRGLSVAALLAASLLDATQPSAQPAQERPQSAALVAEERTAIALQPRVLMAMVPAGSDMIVAGDLTALGDLLVASSPIPDAPAVGDALLRALLGFNSDDGAQRDMRLSELRQAAIGADWQTETIYVTTSPDVTSLTLVDGAAPRSAFDDGLAALRGGILHIGAGDLFTPTFNGTSPTFEPGLWWPDAWARVPEDVVLVVALAGAEWYRELPNELRAVVAAIEPRRAMGWIARDGSAHLMIDAGAPTAVATTLGGVQATIGAFLDASAESTSDLGDALGALVRLAVDGVFSRLSLTTDGSVVSLDLAAPSCGGLAQQGGAGVLVLAMAAVGYTDGIEVSGTFANPGVTFAESCTPPDVDATVDTTALRISGGGPGWMGAYATADVDAMFGLYAATFGGLLPFALDAEAVATALAPLDLTDEDLDLITYIEDVAGGDDSWFLAVPSSLMTLLPANWRSDFTDVGEHAVAGDVEVFSRTGPANQPAGWERAMTLASMDSPGAIVVSGSAVQRMWREFGAFVPRGEVADLMAAVTAFSLSLDAQGRPVAYLVGDFAVDPAAATTSLRVLLTRAIETLAALSGRATDSDLAAARAAAEQLGGLLTFSAIGDDAVALTVTADGNMLLGSLVGVGIAAAPFLPRVEREQMAMEAQQSLYEIYGKVSNRVSSGVQTGVFSMVPASVSATPGLPALAAACDDSEGWITYDPDRWDDPTWQALDFHPPNQHRFVYEFDSTTSTTAASFTARAFGDLDCDGVYSTYRISGAVDPAGWLSGGWVESELAGE